MRSVLTILSGPINLYPRPDVAAAVHLLFKTRKNKV